MCIRDRSDPLADMKKKATADKTDYARSITTFKRALEANKDAYNKLPVSYMTKHAAKIIEAAHEALKTGE